MIALNRTQVVAEWRYVGCSEAMGKQVLVDDLCCNRQCSCKVFGEKVSKTDTNTQITLPIKTLDVAYDNIAYECSRSELDDCQAKCFDALGVYLKRDDLGQLNLKQRNLNIITTHEYSAKQV